MGWISGWAGAGIGQASDWNKHNAIFRDLVERHWPVYYDSGKPAMLTYYIAQYLVPAAVGKVTHSFDAAYRALYIWNCAGTLLIELFVLCIAKIKTEHGKVLSVVAFWLFNGFYLLGQMFCNIWIQEDLTKYFNLHFFNIAAGQVLQYRSIFVSMRWVFPQVIVPWLAVSLFLILRKNYRYYIFIGLPSMLFGTFSFAGLVILLVLFALCDLITDKAKIVPKLKDMFSLQNILLIVPALVMVAYFIGNVFSEKPEEIGFRFSITSYSDLWTFIVFELCAFGIYAFLIFSNYKRNKLFYANTIALIIIPFVRMGINNDWCMCVSLAPLFVLFIMIIAYINDTKAPEASGKSLAYKGALIALLCVAALYPLYEEGGIIKQRTENYAQLMDSFGTLEKFTAWNAEEEYRADVIYNYFTYFPEESLFYKYMAQ